MSEAWLEAYKKTDAQIGENKILYSGTTTVSALVRKKGNERWLHCANVGDARAVLKYVLPTDSPADACSVFAELHNINGV